MPFVVNPTCGALPEPLFIGDIHLFGFLASALLICAVMQKARERWPDISKANLIELPAILGVLLDLERFRDPNHRSKGEVIER